MTWKELFECIKAVHDFCAKYPSDKPCKKCPLYVKYWQHHFEWEDGDAWCILNHMPSTWPLHEIKERLKGDSKWDS